MRKKAVLLLQGGNSFGAFQCGAWKVLCRFLDEEDIELAVVAGASIGAINAALIAKHYGNHDAIALEHFWRHTLAMPAMPFLPFPGEYWRCWNGLLTGLLLGNRALYRPAYANWNLLAEPMRFHLPLYDTSVAKRTLSDAFGQYRGDTPRLLVAASDVQSGRNVLFDSAERTITSDMLTASIALPLLFTPGRVDGRFFWDPEMRSNTLLPDVLSLLAHDAAEQDEPETCLVILVDMMKPDSEHLPRSGMQAYYRQINILLGEKSVYDRRDIEIGNAYLGAMQRLRTLALRHGGSPLAAAVKAEHRRAMALQPIQADLLHIGRDRQFPHEHVSRDLDYSPEYIDRLIAQGIDNASTAIAEYRRARRRLPMPVDASGRLGAPQHEHKTMH